MAEVVAMVVAAVEASTAAVVLAVADFMAVGFLVAASTVVAPTAAITVEDTEGHAALTAVIAEGTDPTAVAVPTEEYAAPLAHTMPGHPKAEAFATHLRAGMGLRPAARVVECLARVVECPLVRDASEELPISTPPSPMVGSTLLAVPQAAGSPATASIMLAS
jgi:hypothetical protein